MREITFPSAHCRVGLACCDITPPVGIYHRMWGAATHDRATGVHQPLNASAVAFGPLHGEGPIKVLLAIDHCLFWGPVMEDLLGKLERHVGLPRSAFLITFSHTHAAGLMDPARTDLPGGDMIPPYLERLGGDLVRIANDARARLRPAWLTFATGRCSLAGQRDFPDAASQQIVCGFNPDGAADDTLLIARINAENGALLGTLVNYACHPTTLAFQNTLISPDFPGSMRALVEEGTGAPCVFLQGASGDLGPREGFVGDVEVAERNGRQLGYAVLAALEGLSPAGHKYVYQGPVLSGATLGLWSYQPLDPSQAKERETFSWQDWAVPLPYREDLPRVESIRAELENWSAKEKAAQGAGDQAAYRDAHAMVERQRRLMARISQLPAGKTFPLPVTLGRLGDASFVFVEGEHYQYLQQALRRDAGGPVFVMTLTNGWRCSYLPTEDAYGKGIYQEQVSVLAKGSLEELARRVGEALRASPTV